MTALGVLCCVALFVCLTLLTSFFHLSLTTCVRGSGRFNNSIGDLVILCNNNDISLVPRLSATSALLTFELTHNKTIFFYCE